jgi:MFS family permease
VIPFTPLLARDLGASVAFASFIVALRGIGMMLFDIPAGMLVGAVGERNAMVVGSSSSRSPASARRSAGRRCSSRCWCS